MKSLLIALFISMLLTGCVTTGSQVTEKTVYVPIPLSLKTKCNVTKPPSRDNYLAVDISNREELLYNYSRSLILDLKECNIQLDKLDQWDKKQDKIYNTGGSDGT